MCDIKGRFSAKNYGWPFLWIWFDEIFIRCGFCDIFQNSIMHDIKRTWRASHFPIGPFLSPWNLELLSSDSLAPHRTVSNQRHQNQKLTNQRQRKYWKHQLKSWNLGLTRDEQSPRIFVPTGSHFRPPGSAHSRG